MSAASNYSQFTVHTRTAQGQTGAANVEFELASNNDVFMIQKSPTGSHTTEVHVLSAASGYQQFSLHAATALGESGSNFEFMVAPNRDLFRKLADSPTPQDLFISCSDCRMIPDLICQTGRGEVLVFRNAGNIVVQIVLKHS